MSKTSKIAIFEGKRIRRRWNQKQEKWYRKGDKEVGNKQFLVMDPDGVLVSICTEPWI